MANLITSCRILLSVAILFFPALSPSFYTLYLLAGFTDMIDGTVARKTNTASEFGSRLDTIADFIFVMVCLLRLLPILNIPTWLWLWIGLIAVFKAVNVVSGFVMRKEFVAVHTIMNKVTGFMLFLFPLTLHFAELKYSAMIVCAVATFAAIQEGHFIRSGRK